MKHQITRGFHTFLRLPYFAQVVLIHSWILEFQQLILSLDLGYAIYFAQVVIIHSWTLELQWLILSLDFWIAGQSSGSKRKAKVLVESEKGGAAFFRKIEWEEKVVAQLTKMKILFINGSKKKFVLSSSAPWAWFLRIPSINFYLGKSIYQCSTDLMPMSTSLCRLTLTYLFDLRINSPSLLHLYTPFCA